MEFKASEVLTENQYVSPAMVLFLRNSSNTSRMTPSDFQTPRGVENTRRSQVFFNERRGVLKSEEDLSSILDS